MIDTINWDKITKTLCEAIEEEVKKIDWKELQKEAREKIEKEKTEKERKQKQMNEMLYGIFNGTIKIKKRG